MDFSSRYCFSLYACRGSQSFRNDIDIRNVLFLYSLKSGLYADEKLTSCASKSYSDMFNGFMYADGELQKLQWLSKYGSYCEFNILWWAWNKRGSIDTCEGRKCIGESMHGLGAATVCPVRDVQWLYNSGNNLVFDVSRKISTVKFDLLPICCGYWWLHSFICVHSSVVILIKTYRVVILSSRCRDVKE